MFGLLPKGAKIKIFRIIIVPFVLYGSETWSFTLKEEHRMKLYENRALRRVFVLKREQIEGDWIRLHSEELTFVPAVIRRIKSRRMRWVGHMARMGKRRGEYNNPKEEDNLESLGEGGG
jgi:hypothetical protein